MQTLSGLAELILQLDSLLDPTYKSPMWSPFPPPDAFDPNWTMDQGFSDSIRRSAIDLVFDNPTAFQNASIALVDLSDSLSPRYGGVSDEAEISVASVAKVAAMFAAYQLREDCRFLAKSLSTMGDPGAFSQALLTALLAKWNDPANPPHVQAIAQSPPKLDKIFEFMPASDGWNVEFRRDRSVSPTADPRPDDETRNAILNSLNTLNQKVKAHGAGPLPPPDALARRAELKDEQFLEWLRLMIGFSNDVAAGFCIRNLGFAYIGALLQQAGLTDLNSRKGLWLSMDYDMINPQEDTWPGHDIVPNVTQAGDAKMLAKFFTLLMQGSLVTGPVSTEMLGLLDADQWMWNASFLGAGIASGSGNKVCTKIGVLRNIIHDAGWIQNGTLSYVAVVLKVTDTSNGPIATARAKLESCL